MAEAWQDLQAHVQERMRRQRAAIMSLCQTYAGVWEAEAKRVRPWQDRSGNARGTLNGRAMLFNPDPDHWTAGVRLAHGMTYGVWLEVTERPRGSAARLAVRRVLGDIPPGPQNRARFMGDVQRVMAQVP